MVQIVELFLLIRKKGFTLKIGASKNRELQSLGS